MPLCTFWVEVPSRYPHSVAPHGGIPQNHAKLDIPRQKPQAMLLPSKLFGVLCEAGFETGFLEGKTWLGVLTVQTSTQKHATADGAKHTSKKKQQQETFHAKGLDVQESIIVFQILSL